MRWKDSKAKFGFREKFELFVQHAKASESLNDGIHLNLWLEGCNVGLHVGLRCAMTEHIDSDESAKFCQRSMVLLPMTRVLVLSGCSMDLI
jgi:hypothetical protein